MTRLTTLAAVGLMLAASGAAAGPAPIRVYREVVPYGDLDLSTETGAQAMLQRIVAATYRVCAQLNTPVLPRAGAAAWRCRARVLRRSVARLHAPWVTREYIRWNPQEAYAMATRPGVR
jgi:UrcA family protein